MYLLIKSTAAVFLINPATVEGMVKTIDAKITGITPALFILIGKNEF